MSRARETHRALSAASIGGCCWRRRYQRLQMAAVATEAQYQVRPSYAEKFRPATVKALIAEALSDKLGDKT